MKIILEGTEAELISALHPFGIPDKVISDDGGNRREVIARTFAEFKAIAQNRLNDFLGTDKTERPQRVKPNLNFMSDSDNDKIKALAKEQANHRREVRQQLISLSKQDIPEAVINYFSGKKTPIIFHNR